MKYFKNVENEYIASISTASGQVEITQEEYENILSVIHDQPVAESGYAYKLRTDLTWELVEVPVVEDENVEISDTEALNIILGGEV